MVLAEVAAAAGQGVFVELHLGPAVITSHPRIVAPAARACQAPAIDRPAPHTFDSKTAAERWLTLTEAEIIHGEWIDPDAGRVLFGKFASDWIEERPGLRPKTIQLYRYLLRSHIAPAFGARSLADIKEPDVRRWRKNLLDAKVSAVTVAKAYRLLKAVFNTAVDDGLIRRNPCRIKGAGQERSPERPVLNVAQVYAVADAVGGR
jgi:hypothetical protein